MAAIAISLSDERAAQLRLQAEQAGLTPEEFLRLRVEQLLDRPDKSFGRAAAYSHDIPFRNSRRVYVEALAQYLTYPDGAFNLTPEANQERILAALDRAHDLFGEERIIRIEPYCGLNARTGEPAMLPLVTCLAKVIQDTIVEEKGRTIELGSPADNSYAVVVWFQNDFVFPIDAKVLTILREIAWEEDAEPDVF